MAEVSHCVTYSTQKMEVIFSFEMWTTRCCIPDDITLNTHRCENRKYNINIFIYTASSIELGGSSIHMHMEGVGMFTSVKTMDT
jgi:hypothetical protein